MKIFPALLFCLTIPIISTSQQFTASVNNERKAYVGSDNYISCTVQGYTCKSIELVTDNGVLKREGCRYILHPVNPDDAEITVMLIKNNTRKKIGSFFIAVREIVVGAYVGGISHGEMSKGALAAQNGIGCSAIGSRFELKFTVDSFTVTVFRKDSVLYRKQQNGNLFIEETRTFFRSLQPNDIVLFSEIICIYPEQKRKRVNPIELIIR